MRVSSIGWLFDDYDSVKERSRRSAVVSHSHPEGIKGAQCVASLIYWLRTCRVTKEQVAASVKRSFGYEIPPMRDILRIGSHGHFDGTCQETVPMAIRCFLDAESFEETIRLAVLCDGDTDTKAAIAGSIAEAYYEIPTELLEQAFAYLPAEMLDVLQQFLRQVKDNIG
jgi:ADP-ribosylglycohydrolase